MAKITIGVDIGGSTTKIVGLKDNNIVTPMRVKADDPVTSLFGAFGKFMNTNRLSLDDVEKVMLTGVGASYIDSPIYGISTNKVEEFLANGLGGLYTAKLSEALIVSMGTGTSIVMASNGDIRHIGGTGIGGGTIIGLADRILRINTMESLIKKAENGNLKNVDLRVGDLTKDILPGLPPDITASNFGKVSDIAEAGDVALGILNLVFQAIGSCAIFAVKNTNMKDIVLIGNLTSIPQCKDIFNRLEVISDISFVIPEYAEYSTAVGAALAYKF